MTGEEEALALSRLDSLEHRVEGLERGRERQHEILKEMERTLGTLPRRVGKLEAEELQPQITKLFEITNEHWDRMEGGDEAHRALMARVARCEARLDGRGHEVARDLTPAEAMDAVADMIRAGTTQTPAMSDLMDMDPDTPGRWTTASPEDTEGLEPGWPRLVWVTTDDIQEVMDGLADTMLASAESDGEDEAMVPLSDAVEKIDRLTARLEEAERVRDEAKAESGISDALFSDAKEEISALRQRLEGMVVTEGMVKMSGFKTSTWADQAAYITRALHAQEADDE